MPYFQVISSLLKQFLALTLFCGVTFTSAFADSDPQINNADIYALPEGETITLTGSNLGGATSARMIWVGPNAQYPTTTNTIDTNTLEVLMPDVYQEIRDHHLLVETDSGSTIGIPNGFDELNTDGLVSNGSYRGTLVVKAGAVLSGEHYYNMIIVETGGVIEVSSSPIKPLIVAQDGAVIDFTAASTSRATCFYSPDTVILGDIPSNATTEQLTSIKPSYGIETFTVGQPINITIVGDGNVSASPEQPYYPLYSYVDLIATPGSNSTFSGWSGSESASSTSLQVYVQNAPVELTATFSPGWLLQLYDVPGVSTSTTPSSSVYSHGETVTLSATVETGYTFLGWGGDVNSVSISSNITMDANKSIIPIVRKEGYDQLPQLSSADLYALPQGETITLTGSNLDDATSARMIWVGPNTQSPTTTNTIDANTLEVLMPDVYQEIRDHHLLVETDSGSTIGIPNGFDELNTDGLVSNGSYRGTLVVKAGAVLSGEHSYNMIIVETGGVIEVSSSGIKPVIVAQDGAVIDFTAASTSRATCFYSPDTVILGDIPSNATTEQLTSITPSYGIETFTVGYPLNVEIEGPGTVSVSPEKTFYALNESVQITATADLNAYFIRWIGTTSGHDNTINISIRNDTTQIARFSTAPDYFSSWRLEHFTIDELESINISAFDADPDNDSLTNAAEYAFGTDPRSSNQRDRIKVYKEKVDGLFRHNANYTRPKSALDVTYQILLSKDLTTWNFNGDDTGLIYSEEISVESIDDENEEVTLRLYPESDVPKTFFIKVSAILFE